MDLRLVVSFFICLIKIANREVIQVGLLANKLYYKRNELKSWEAIVRMFHKVF